MSADEENLKKFCNQILKFQVFKGTYTERRYLDSVNEYRDVVQIDKNEEKFKTQLEHILNKLRRCYYHRGTWIGITTSEMIGAPSAMSIWTTDLENKPLGEYFFTIKSLKFDNKEISIKLRAAKEVETETPSMNADNHVLDALYGLWMKMSTELTKLIHDINSSFTRDNIVEAIKFLFILFLSLIQGTMAAAKFLSLFSLRLLAEFRNIVYVITPIVIRLIEFAEKMIAGFYMLIALMWRGNRPNPQMFNWNNRALPAPNRRNYWAERQH